MRVGVEKLIRAHLVGVDTYTPVDPTEKLARRAGIRPEDVVRLNANENPFGPTPAVTEAIQKARLHVYPDPEQRRVREALADYTGMGTEYLLAGAGSDDFIDILMRLFVAPRERVLDCVPTFGMYSFFARVADAEVHSIQRDGEFDVDVAAVADQADDRTKIVFFASPNNPTGNMLTEEAALELLDLNLVVVVDETYYEFSGETLASLVAEHDNLVILRSLSKWAGLAGLRIGYAIAAPSVIAHLNDIKQPYNVSVAAEAALLASLEDRATLMKNVELLVAQRRRMESALDTMDGIEYSPSHGNFLLCEFSRSGEEVYEEMATQGVFVRHFSDPRLTNHLRISAGTPEETDRLLEVLAAVT